MSQSIELFISARALKNADVFSKSDPYVIVSIFNNNHWVKVGRTETINNNLNPNFQKTFQVEYIFETKQLIRFEVLDDDGDTSDRLGQVETTVGTLFGAKNQTSILNLEGGGKGKLVVRCERVAEGNLFFVMKWAGIKLMNTDSWIFNPFDKSDPFLRFFREREDGQFLQVHQTEHILNDLNPQWKPFEIQAARLATTNDKKIKIECWDWESNDKFQFIGDVILCPQDFKQGQQYKLKNPKKKDPGSLTLQIFTQTVKPSFMDYIRGGLQINLIVAVDFTGSNGDPHNPSSLHFRNPNYPNQYQQAITSVGEILLAYDYDKLVPCYGFGAQTNYPTLQSRQELHCFPLSGNPAQTDAFQLQGILDLYNYALANVVLSGPTYFGPIIAETMKIAQMMKDQEQEAYTILQILTDGEIHDMDLTKRYIVQSSRLPLSIIIIGVGNCNFKQMEELDGDDGLWAGNQKAERDLVQFVPIKNYQGNPAALAKEVLAEIPGQIVQYFNLIGKPPRQPVQVDINLMGYTVQPEQVQQFQQFQQTLQH